MLKIVFSCPFDDNAAAVARPPRIRYIDLLRARQILPGQRFLAAHNILHAALRDQLTAVKTRARTDIHDMVRRVHGILIVFNDNQRIPDVGQMAQRLQ